MRLVRKRINCCVPAMGSLHDYMTCRRFIKRGFLCELRSIVSLTNSPTYNVSHYLARVLSPVVGNTDNTVKNSQQFANHADQMRSYHLTSFPCSPKYLLILLSTLPQIDLDMMILCGNVIFALKDIIDLLSFCLNTTQFVFEGT